MFTIVQQTLLSAQSSIRITVHELVSVGYEVSEISRECLESNPIRISFVRSFDNTGKFL